MKLKLIIGLLVICIIVVFAGCSKLSENSSDVIETTVEQTTVVETTEEPNTEETQYIVSEYQIEYDEDGNPKLVDKSSEYISKK